MYKKVCTECELKFETTDPEITLCYYCYAVSNIADLVEEQREEDERNRKEYRAFQKNECDDCTDPDLYADDEERQAAEDFEQENLDREAFHQEQLEEEDNDESSGWTDLGNPGGTTFCW